MLIAAYNVYDELGLLERSLRTLVGEVDKVVIAHGVFKGFGKPVDKREGIKIILERLKIDNYKLVYKREWSSIFEATSEKMNYGSVGDIQFNIAPDELVLGGMASTKYVIDSMPDKRVFYVNWFLETSTGIIVQRPRLYRWEKGLHFEQHHSYLYDAEGKIVDGYGFGGDNAALVPLVMVHLDHLHSARYKELKRVWRLKGGDRRK